MRILAIETSCDETAVAVVEDLRLHASRLRSRQNQTRFRILSNVISSQVKTHAPFGGVVPNLAKREHQRNLVPVLLRALEEAGLLKNHKTQITNHKQISKSKTQTIQTILEREQDLFTRLEASPLLTQIPPVDAIAVTIGPGLAPALWVGVNFARALAYAWNKPIIPVNHMEAHLYSNFYGPRRTFRYPTLCLTVSGGHTQLILMTSLKRYRVLGETRDDAAGEAFDKGARLLGLAYPGGPKLAELAREGNPRAFAFPRPMLNQPAGGQNHEFSFAGLKTSLLYLLKDNPELLKRKADLAASYEAAIVDVLVAKTLRAAREFRAKTVFIAGGVAANQKLRRELREQATLLPTAPRVYAPEKYLSTDNAVMVAMAAAITTSRLPPNNSWQRLDADANLGL
ncbi:MAG: tRNA (adenosine(37)-N6)-threonylcarbamoyltransferase complex transferase subunit TsaD [Parcubacteria group bacterium]|nr:tRNA (adenosine(37)-N6)-threonylcarbamoyltransferase complex transferase subunit TsaD [Parcubacteria group bacterium]